MLESGGSKFGFELVGLEIVEGKDVLNIIYFFFDVFGILGGG